MKRAITLINHLMAVINEFIQERDMRGIELETWLAEMYPSLYNDSLNEMQHLHMSKLCSIEMFNNRKTHI